MRRVVCVSTIAAVIAAGFPSSSAIAQTAVVPVRAPFEATDTIAGIIKAYPNGGAEMAARIADLLTRDPNLAKELVIHARSAQLNEQQRKAARQGLAEALTRLQATNHVKHDDENPALIAILMAAFTLLGFVGFIDDDEDKRVSSPH